MWAVIGVSKSDSPLRETLHARIPEMAQGKDLAYQAMKALDARMHVMKFRPNEQLALLLARVSQPNMSVYWTCSPPITTCQPLHR